MVYVCVCVQYIVRFAHQVSNYMRALTDIDYSTLVQYISKCVIKIYYLGLQGNGATPIQANYFYAGLYEPPPPPGNRSPLELEVVCHTGSALGLKSGLTIILNVNFL